MKTYLKWLILIRIWKGENNYKAVANKATEFA
jgi:hypothetical protein